MKNKNSKLNWITTPPTPLLRKEGGMGGGLMAILIFLLLATPAFAQNQYNLIEPLPGIQQVKDFPDFVSRFIPFLLAFAALAAFVQIVFGGILRATSGGNPSAIGDANDRIWQAILGLVLALSAYLILNTINPDLVSLRFFPERVEIKPTITESAKEDLCKAKKCAPTDKCIITNNKVICIPLTPMGP